MKVRLAVNRGTTLGLGPARLALLNALHARRHGGEVLLRIDDPDPAHADPAAEETLRGELGWLGLEWDRLWRQSDRAGRYQAAARRLEASGRIYPCFESEEELRAKRDVRQRRGQATLYDRGMLKMTREQRRAAEAGGKSPYWRFLLSARPVGWHDMVLGAREVKLSAVSDPVVIRADGVPLGAFAAAVDDLDAGITDIVRGEEHVGFSGIQLDIAAALSPGRPAPRLAHVPTLRDGAGDRLARSAGKLTLRGLRADGVEAAAIAGLLAAVGTDGAAVPGSVGSLADGFRLGRLAQVPAQFDGEALLALNRSALRELPFEAVRDRLPPAATPAFWSAIRGEIALLNEARGWWDVVAGSIVPPLIEGEAGFLRAALAALPAEPWDDGVWRRWREAIAAETGRSGDQLTVPLHQALTGEEHGPALEALLPLMGRARAAERLGLAAT